MPNEIQKLLFHVVANNSYFSHPENLLLTMLVDENQTIRQRSIDLIIKARRKTHQGVRKFYKPTPNYKARTYYEMVNLNNNANLFEPPLLIGISNEKLYECVNTHQNFVAAMIENIPCHTQAVERVIRSVSEASHSVFGEENRHARVCANLQSRALLPQTNTKSDYKNYAKY